MKAIAIVLLTAACATAQDYPYPPDWNPNAADESDRTCASKYRGRQFTCTVTTEAAPLAPFDVVIYTDRLPLAERPGAYDVAIPQWDMVCACGTKSKDFRTSRNAFLCAGDGGAFAGTRVSHSDMKGIGQGTPFGGSWRANCDDFVY